MSSLQTKEDKRRRKSIVRQDIKFQHALFTAVLQRLESTPCYPDLKKSDLRVARDPRTRTWDYTEWSSADIEKLKQFANEGASMQKIAMELNRSRPAISAKLGRLGLRRLSSSRSKM